MAKRNTILALGAAVLVLAFWKLRLTDPATEYTFGSSDFYLQLYPMWVRAGMWMRAGVLPLWNPYQMGGHPFLASLLYGVLYPPNLVRLFVPAEIAIEVNLVLHLWLAAVFMYLYGRSIGLRQLSAALAGLAYALSGIAAAEATWFTASIAAMVWLPLGLAAVEKILRGGATARRWTAALAVAVAMPILAGWLQTWLYNAWALGAYAACHVAARLWRGQPGRGARGAMLVACGVLLGIGAAAVQLLPSNELQALGPRRLGGLSLDQTLPVGALPPAFFLRGIIDADPGPPRTYAGIATLLLLPLALATPRLRPRALLLTAMALTSLLISFSVHTPLFALSRLLPGGTWFRGPSRILCLWSFAMAALAGIGLEALLRSPRRQRWIAILPIAAALALSLAAVPMLTRVYAAAGALLLLGGLLAPPQGRRRSVFAIMVAGLIGLDLFAASANPSARPLHNLALYETQRDVFNYIALHQGLDRTYVPEPKPPAPPGVMSKQGTLRGVFMVNDYEVLSLERTERFFEALAGRFRDPPSKGGPFTGTLHLDLLRLKQLGLLSVRFIVVRRDDGSSKALEDEGWQIVFEAADGVHLVYENPRVLPRAYVVHSAPVAPDADTALNWMLRGVFDPWRSAVLEAGAEGAPEELASLRPITPAIVRSYEPTRVEIEADAAKPGYLILSDTFYPGWEAEVDGEPAAIHRANYLFRGVYLTAGPHRVSFVYRPRSLQIGALLSFISCVMVTLMALGGGVSLSPGSWRSRRESLV